MLTEAEKNALQQDVAVFIAAVGRDIAELRRIEALAADAAANSRSSSVAGHRNEVLVFLSEVTRRSFVLGSHAFMI